MTSALNPSQWYSALRGYKEFQPNHGSAIASIAFHFFDTHASRIEAMLGGPPTVFTIVPSKQGKSYSQQPLRAALSRVETLKNRLRHTLLHRGSQTYARRQYCPEIFAPGPIEVRGERIVLIEDTWVTGATAVSAAGALLENGATAVGIFPVARVLNAEYWPGDHPYRLAMQREFDPYDPTRWPR